MCSLCACLADVYASVPNCTGTNPLIGPATGGLTIYLMGSNFVMSPSLICKFYEAEFAVKYVAPTFYDSNTVTLLTPALPTGTVNIACSNDGGLNYGEPTSIRYSDSKLTNLLGIIPAHGPTTGKTLCYINMLGVVPAAGDDSWLWFRLFLPTQQGAPMKATYVYDTGMTTVMVVTIPPSNFTPGIPLQVQISLDNQTSWASSLITTFTYDQPIILTAVSPSTFYTNYTLMLTVVGNNFIAPGNPYKFMPNAGSLKPNSNNGLGLAAEIFCRFNYSQTVTAYFLNSSAIVCQYPFYYGYVGNIPLDVTFNNQQYTPTPLGITLLPFPQLLAVSPNRFAGDNTTTTMYLFGLYFVPTVRLAVQFGSLYPNTTTVPAVFVNSTTLRVPVPPALFFFGNMTVAVTIDDGLYYTWPPLYVSVQPTLSVVHMFPASGLATGSTLVFFAGRSFKNVSSILCRLGSQGVLVAPIWVEPNMLACLIPPRAALLMPTSRTQDPPANIPAYINSWPVDYDLSVALVTNFQDTTTPFTFRYYGQCPAGSYCLDNSYIQPCPPGAFCPNPGMLTFMLCPPGTYQSRSGALYCFLCPVGMWWAFLPVRLGRWVHSSCRVCFPSFFSGTFCPDYGMAAPSICPPGWMCSVNALINPVEFCPVRPCLRTGALVVVAFLCAHLPLSLGACFSLP